MRRSATAAPRYAILPAPTAPPATLSSATTCTTAPGRNAGAARRRSASSCRDSARPTSALPARSSFGFQPFFHRGVNELGDVAAERGDFAHQRGRDEHVLLGGREEHRFH